jgi:hypothetical protein
MAVKKITPTHELKTAKIGVRLTPSMVNKLNLLAKEHKVSVGRLVELSIEEFLRSN